MIQEIPDLKKGMKEGKMSEEKGEIKREEDNERRQNSSTGLDSNIAGLLSYVFGWITGLIFFLLEEKDEYVRFHAMQSIIVFGAITVLSIIFGILFAVPFLGAILGSFLWIASIVLWIILIVKAYQGERFKLPIAGDLAEKYSARRK